MNAPTREEAQRARLFSPLRHAGVSLDSRTWVPAMVPWRATADGEVTEELLRWYERFAQGKPGVIVVEATGISGIASGPLLRIGHPRFEEGLARLVERVRVASRGKTRLLIQLIDFLALRRRPSPERYFRKYLRLRPEHAHAVRDLGYQGDSPEALREFLFHAGPDTWARVLNARESEDLERGYRERVDDLILPHIAALPAQLPERFAQATARAKRVGFDGVELHYAHAYTMASFLSAKNRRQDGYGRTLSGRLRLPIEVLAACRVHAEPGFWVGLRMLSRECVDGGSTLEESCEIATQLAKAGADFISLSRGGKFDDAKIPKPGQTVYPYTGPSGYECMPTIYSDGKGPFGRNLADCAQIRSALHRAGVPVPVVAAGGFCSFSQMESALLNGQADIIAAARQSMADPDWWEKLRQGQGDRVRRCSFTNYCEALDQRHKVVTCKLWDRQEVPACGPDRSEDGHRRLVAPPLTPSGCTTSPSKSPQQLLASSTVLNHNKEPIS